MINLNCYDATEPINKAFIIEEYKRLYVYDIKRYNYYAISVRYENDSYYIYIICSDVTFDNFGTWHSFIVRNRKALFDIRSAWKYIPEEYRRSGNVEVKLVEADDTSAVYSLLF